jgi:hypothetical protein
MNSKGGNNILTFEAPGAKPEVFLMIAPSKESFSRLKTKL